MRLLSCVNVCAHRVYFTVNLLIYVLTRCGLLLQASRVPWSALGTSPLIPAMLRAIEALWPRQSDVRSLCINTAVAKIFGVVSSSSIGLIIFTAGFSHIHSVIVERRRRFLAKLQSPLFCRFLLLFYDKLS